MSKSLFSPLYPLFYFFFFFVTVAAPYPKTSIKQIFENRKSIKSDIFIPATTSKYPIKEHIDQIDAENCEEKPIGFVTEWISTYIFLESKCVILKKRKKKTLSLIYRRVISKYIYVIRALL